MTKWFAGRPSVRKKKPHVSATLLRAIEPLEPRVLLSASPSLRALRRVDPTPAVLHPMYEMAPSANPLGPAFTSSPVGVTPAQMRHFYGVDQVNFNGIVGDGTGQTIAIVDAYDDPTASTDLHNFDQALGLSDAPGFQKFNQNGGTTLPGVDPAHTTNPTNTWEIEESLDIEWAHVIAPNASIDLFEANDASPSNLYVAARSAAKATGVVVVSMSFGGAEQFNESQNDGTYFVTPAGHPGVTFLAATGDQGVGSYPAYSPNVIAVGGTTMAFANDGMSYGTETAWSGSGGGPSSYETEPSYQTPVQSSGSRETPDVAMDADPASGVPVYDSFDFGASTPWGKYGGTSLATPMWAALIAIADQGRGTSFAGQGALNALYSAPQTDFHDVTLGSNTGGFHAGTGYDEVTGRGTPIANKLLNDLAGVPPAPATVVGQYIFYNDSAFDGKNPAANAADDNAIDPNKQALLPMQTASFANYTSYSNGINGMMIDAKFLAAAPTAADFTFLAGTTADPTTWSAAPAPASVLVRPGAGAGGSTRIELTWADGSIRNEWLKVTMNADTVTGLAAPDVFYFGNLVGESGKPPVNGQFVVTADDVTAARNAPHTFLNPATLQDNQDFNRDGTVNALDQLIARMNIGVTLIQLAAPAAPALASLASATAPSNAVYTSSGWWSSPDPVHKRNDLTSILLARRVL